MKYDEVPIPEYAGRKPQDVWPAFFKQYRPRPAVVGSLIRRLNNDKQHEHTISCIQSALINGQSQPWMYEVLALSMEIAGRPAAEVERVVLSLSDFGQADYGAFMYSGAYLARFKRPAAALRMYRQASRMMPERPEPYILGLKLAQELKSPEDVAWAATGILEHYWNHDYQARHRDAELAVAEVQRQLQRAGESEIAGQLGQQMRAAQIRDLKIRVEWSGAADLDLLVEEPSGAVCSFSTPETAGGGLLTHDGCGPDASLCYEEYVAPRAYSGDYRITIKNAGGSLVGNRAVVIITMNAGGPKPIERKETVNLSEGDAILRVTLDQGRRTQPRAVLGQFEREFLEQLQAASRPQGRRQAPGAGQRVAQELLTGRANAAQPRRAGAFAYAPGVQIIPEGTILSGSTVVSADRRYVRLAISPTFNTITDVFTYSIFGGQTTQQSGGQGQR
ncbi:MAG: hypothetical protein KDA90_08730 [Planctomycetaceae bacterium]|nr:hypothetical protein [Planctomycetaceae bacterium]